MWLRRVLATGLTVAIFIFMGSSSPSHAQSGTHVYMLRGFMNVFSMGLDSLAQKLEEGGIRTSVANHFAWSSYAQDAIGKYKSGKVRSIIIIGHSLGGGAALSMAEQLREAKVPVSLVITLDPVGTPQAPANVRRLINLYVSNGMGSKVERSSKFRGSLVNSDQKDKPDIGHVSITTAFQRKLLGYVRSAATSSRPRNASVPETTTQ